MHWFTIAYAIQLVPGTDKAALTAAVRAAAETEVYLQTTAERRRDRELLEEFLQPGAAEARKRKEPAGRYCASQAQGIDRRIAQAQSGRRTEWGTGKEAVHAHELCGVTAWFGGAAGKFYQPASGRPPVERATAPAILGVWRVRG